MAKKLEWNERKASSSGPRTPLGRRLSEIRSKIVASGERMLEWDEIDSEIARRRGRQSADEG